MFLHENVDNHIHIQTTSSLLIYAKNRQVSQPIVRPLYLIKYN